MPTVIILAAGRGGRMMPITDAVPKILVNAGDGGTILDHHLATLAKCGLRRIRLVLGYRSEQVEAELRRYPDFDFEIVYNPFYDVADNLVSAWMGLRFLRDRAVLINGDNIYSPGIVNRLTAATQEISMAVRKKDVFDSDDMKVIVRGGLVVDVGKTIRPSDANGESVGMIAFNAGGLTAMWNCLDRMVRDADNLRLFYLAALRRLMLDAYPVHANECSGESWAEIDFAEDLARLRHFHAHA